MEREFELKLSDGGKIVSWLGKDGVDAATRYAAEHAGAVVIAWRYPKVAVVVGIPRIVE